MTIIYLFIFFTLIFFWWNEAARGSTASFRVHFQRANDFTQFNW